MSRVQPGQYFEGQNKGFCSYFNSKRKIRGNTDPVLDEVSPPENMDKAEMFNDLLTEVIVLLCCSAASPQVMCAVLGTTISEAYETFRKHLKEDCRGGGRSQGLNLCVEAGITWFVQRRKLRATLSQSTTSSREAAEGKVLVSDD